MINPTTTAESGASTGLSDPAPPAAPPAGAGPSITPRTQQQQQLELAAPLDPPAKPAETSAAASAGLARLLLLDAAPTESPTAADVAKAATAALELLGACLERDDETDLQRWAVSEAGSTALREAVTAGLCAQLTDRGAGVGGGRSRWQQWLQEVPPADADAATSGASSTGDGG
eukprot:SAG31_NODE_12183_length_960_cov_9.714286_1_plen_173_part_10